MFIRRLAVGAAVTIAATAALSTPAHAQEQTTNGDITVLFNCGTYDDNHPVTRADTLARSITWIQAKVPYSQAACKSNKYGSFRTDCSGYLSMIWHLRYSYTTDTLDQVSHPIARADLRTGDALLDAGSHVALFIGWADAAHTQPRVREQAGPDGSPTVERVWSQATASIYTPIRYDKIVESDEPSHAADGTDIDGNGAADLLGTKADGTLWYYHNDGTADGDPINGSGTQIGTGFGVFDWLDAADISGDGSADLVARKPDGTLWYYPNNHASNPGGVPFVGSGTQIGSGFGAFDVINAADLSGDGSADLFARKPDGTLFYYPNNRASNPGGVPFAGSGIQIGTGFDNFNKLT